MAFLLRNFACKYLFQFVIEIPKQILIIFLPSDSRLHVAAQVNRKIESDIEFSGRRDRVTAALGRRVYSRNSEASVSNDGKIPGFCFC